MKLTSLKQIESSSDKVSKELIPKKIQILEMENVFGDVYRIYHLLFY